MLAFLAALVITIGGVGWYLDWFEIHSGQSSNGHHSFELDVDTSKIKDDIHKGEEKLLEKADKKQKEEKAKENTGAEEKDN
jgi:hypothetical protein